MEKYYIPKLEEFCIGFEYEFLDMLKYSKTKGNWIKKIVKLNDLATILRRGFRKVGISHLLKNNKIRVKCLDRDDIESFNLFKWNKRIEDGWIVDVYDYNSEFVHITIEHSITENNIRIIKNQFTLYWGECLNKLEFKKILKKVLYYGK